MTQALQQDAPAPRTGREGNRWVNTRPSAEEFGDWFRGVEIHDKLYHEEFVGGITVIQQVAKSQEVIGYDQDNRPLIGERTDLEFVPYARVDTRIAYFWALMREHPEWLGAIEANPIGRPDPSLPPGFFQRVVESPNGKLEYIGCSMRVRIEDRISGRPVGIYPAGTKVVAVGNKYDFDQHALAKAETGAIGRALGMAGMLVIPGSGVATAEDVQDAVAASVAAGTARTAPAVGLPADASPAMDDVDGLRAEIKAALAELGKHPDQLKLFQEWAKERDFGHVDSLEGPALKGILRKLQKELDTAKSAAIRAERAAGDEGTKP